MRARRELAAAVLVCLAGAGLVLLAAHGTWAAELVRRAAPLPARHERLSGTDLTGLPRALGLFALAGALAVLATRRLGRVIVGALVALAGVGVAADAIAVAGGQPAARTVTVWPWLCVLGGVLVALSGVAVLLRGRQWAAMGTRYDAPSARQPAKDPEVQMWDALDRGEDPTEQRAARPER